MLARHYFPSLPVGAHTADTTAVSEIMSFPVFTAHPDLGARALANLFLARTVSGAVVVDDEGHPLGVVSKTDLVRAQYEVDSTRPMPRVKDIMMPIVFAVSEHTSIGKAAALMAFEGVHRLPVVSGHEIVGIVSSLDILAWLGQESGWLIPRARPDD